MPSLKQHRKPFFPGIAPHKQNIERVALPLALNGVAPDERAARVDRMLEAVGLATAAASFPRELSGGEMQRAAIARALVHRPQLLLADEPTGNLDQDAAAQVLGLPATTASSVAEALAQWVPSWRALYNPGP